MFYQLEHIGTADHLQIEKGKNFNYPPHLHQCFELIYLERGEMTVVVNGVSYLMRERMALLIFPNQIHSIQSTVSEHMLFIFSPNIVQTYYSDVVGRLPKSCAFVPSNTCIELLKALSLDSTLCEIKGALYTACAFFDAQAEYYDSASDKENTLFKILFYVEENFKASCNVGDIANAIHYNSEYISRFFKNKMGFSCNYYINARRLSHAAYLLTNTNTPCIRCAMESGFASLRTFNRNFKIHFGISPTEYREKICVSVQKQYDL